MRFKLLQISLYKDKLEVEKNCRKNAHKMHEKVYMEGTQTKCAYWKSLWKLPNKGISVIFAAELYIKSVIQLTTIKLVSLSN